MKKNIRRTWTVIALLAFLGVTAFLVAPTINLSAFMEFADETGGHQEGLGDLVEVMDTPDDPEAFGCSPKICTTVANCGTGCTRCDGASGDKRCG